MATAAGRAGDLPIGISDMPGDQAGVCPGDGDALLCNGTGDGLLSNASGDGLLSNASGDALLCNGAVCTPCLCIDMPGLTNIIMSCCTTWPAMAWLACPEGAPPSCTCTGAPESADRVLLQGIVGTTWDTIHSRNIMCPSCKLEPLQRHDAS